MESKVSSLSDGRSDVYLLPHRSPSPSYHSPSPSHRSPSPSPPSWSTGFRWLSIRGRRLLFATCACLAAASLFGLMTMMLWSYQSKSQVVLDHESQLSGVAKPKVDEWGPLSVLRGPATDSLWGLSKCSPSNHLQLNNFWQIICKTTQSILHRGLRLAGVCDLVYFDDNLDDLLFPSSSQQTMS
jgi:hypothetical protein